MKPIRIYEKEIFAMLQPLAKINAILIHQRQSERQRIDSLCHEVLHVLFPRMSDSRTWKMAAVLADVIWRQGYRRKKSRTPGSSRRRKISPTNRSPIKLRTP